MIKIWQKNWQKIDKKLWQKIDKKLLTKNYWQQKIIDNKNLST